MADKMTTTNTLGIELEENESGDTDGKIQKMTLKLPNPKNNLTEAYIRENMQSLLTTVLVPQPEGEDPTSQAIFNVIGAYKEVVEKVELDIGVESA